MRRVRRRPADKPRKKIGRPRREVFDALAFGREVERERKPYDKLETVFHRLHRRDPRRWKSERTMFRLWGEFRDFWQ